MTEVHPNLYISAIPEHKPCPRYRAIVSVLTPPLSSYPSLQRLPANTAHLYISLCDSEYAVLLPYLTDCVRFIEDHISSPVLVHCFHGVSRSVAVCIAYMSVASLSLSDNTHRHAPASVVSDALAAVRERYARAYPLPNFVDQVVAFVSCMSTNVLNASFPPSSEMTVIPSEVVNTVLRLCSVVRSDALVDLCIDTPGKNVSRSNAVCCVKCAVPLLPLNAILNPHRGFRDEILVYPIKWMGNAMTNSSQNRIRCWSCNGRVGYFTRGDIHRGIPSRFALAASAVDVPLNQIANYIRIRNPSSRTTH